MTSIRSMAAAIVALAAFIAPAHPQTAKPTPIKLETLKKGPIMLDPQYAYILVRIGPKADAKDRPVAVTFSRLSDQTGTNFTPEDYKADKTLLRTVVVAVNTGRSFADQNQQGAYVIKAWPGTWFLSNTATTSFALGTYKFTIKAGEVTDIGTVLVGREDGKSASPEISATKLSQDLVDFGVALNIVMTDAIFVKSPVEGVFVPSELAGVPIVKAVLQPDYQTNATGGFLLNRAASLPPLGHQPPLDKLPVPPIPVEEAKAAGN